MCETLTSEDITRAFAFLLKHFHFRIASRIDDPIVGSSVAFARDNVKIVVEYERRARQHDVMFELYDKGKRLEHRTTLYLVLLRANAVPVPGFGTPPAGPLHQLRRTAEFCEKYAVPAIEGSAVFYEELRVLNEQTQRKKAPEKNCDY